MIRFSCEHCGHKIAAEETHIGKRGKCPACGTIVTVPAESTLIEFTCSTRKREFVEPQDSGGKLVECPHCKAYVPVPLEERPAQKAAAPPRPGEEDDTSDQRFEQLQAGIGKMPAKEPDHAAERHLPWIFDIFLYPASRPGLTILGIAAVVRVVFRIVIRLLGTASQQFLPCLAFFGLTWAVGMFVRIVLLLYVWWYLCECIRDSAAGGIRAPETSGRSPGMGGMLWQTMMTSGCFILFLGPPVFYCIETKTTDAVFWVLVVYGAIFFPMSLLAVVVFDSWQGLNPILLIRAIFSTFLPHCAMIVGIALFVAAGIFSIAKLPNPKESSLGLFILWCVSIYLTMIVAHLLGAFCHRYKDKLNWDV